MSEQDSSIPTPNEPSRLVLPGWLMHLALVLPCAALLTSVYIQHSMSVGRLAWGLPLYDDVFYFDDALDRLDIFYRQGFNGLLQGHWHNPPHSPWSSYSALVGYAVFGRTLWAPYAVNGVLLLVAFLIVERVAGTTRPWIAFLLTALLWAMPFSVSLILECRPDGFCGLVSAYALYLMASKPLTEWTTKEAAWIGTLWGLTTWIKPAIFVQTGIFCIGALGWWWLLAMRESPRRWQSLLRNSAWVAGIGCLVALPHLGVHLRHYLTYMIDNQFGVNHHLWVTDGGLERHFWQYTHGVAGRMMFGASFSFILVYVACTLTAAVRQRQRNLARQLTTLLVLSFMCWLVPTLNEIKTRYFGMTFGALMLLALVRSLSAWLNRELMLPQRVSLGAGWCAAAHLLLGCVITKGYMPIPPDSPNGEAEVAQAVFDQLAKQVAIVGRDRKPGQVNVAVPFRGILNSHLLGWQFQVNQRKKPKLNDCFFAEASAHSFNVVQHADLVLLPEPGMSPHYVNSRFLVGPVHEQLLAELSQDPSYCQCATVATPDGKRFVIFAHDRNTRAASTDPHVEASAE